MIAAPLILAASILSLSRGIFSGQPSLLFTMSPDSTGFTTTYSSYSTNGTCIHLGITGRPNYRWSCHIPIDDSHIDTRISIRACLSTTCSPYIPEPNLVCTCAAPYTGCLDTLYPEPPFLITNVVANSTSTSTINITWDPPPCNATSVTLERSTDGINFVPIANCPPGQPCTRLPITVPYLHPFLPPPPPLQANAQAPK